MLRFALFLCVASAMLAAPITGLNNTGTNAIGGVDQSWTVTPLPGGNPGTPFAPVVVTGWPVTGGGPWLANDATSSWIAKMADYTGQADLEGTVYRFDLPFNLAPEYANMAYFRFRVAADNAVSRVFLNNTEINGVTAPDNFDFSDVYTVASGFQASNVFSVYVFNASGLDGNPMGLRVEFTESADTPEPGTFALLGGALCGLGLITRLLRK